MKYYIVYTTNEIQQKSNFERNSAIAQILKIIS